ncbi:hypothetical protein NC653_000084 [Populus alba x Populus x berolinensis]|uniref:Uncharacterized protein n=1 Tax=Populus alba x Populus x berolinensis TaxID=444605 RepID=A0AAD6RHU5_9ROSI|nr:hypothetical protein NC653_000084 [Populus alba x Populus x berolinensis]
MVGSEVVQVVGLMVELEVHEEWKDLGDDGGPGDGASDFEYPLGIQNPTVLAVIIIADLMAAGLQSGCADLSKAATPLT